MSAVLHKKHLSEEKRIAFVLFAGASGGRSGFGEVACAPEIPTGDGAVRGPFFGAALHDSGFGEIGSFNCAGFGEAEESEREAFADAVIGDGKNVGAAETEDEEHLDGQATNAANGGESSDDFSVGHFLESGILLHGAVEDALGEIFHGAGFVGGDTAAAQEFVGCGEEGFGGWVAAVEIAETAVDGSSGFAVELLIEDGFEEGFKNCHTGVDLHGEGAGAFDEAGEFGVGIGEVLNGYIRIEGKFFLTVVNHGTSLAHHLRWGRRLRPCH